MIRFACPGCKSMLSAQDEQAGRIVTCPKCGQRMHAPGAKSARRPLRSGIVLGGVLLLAGAGGGFWWWMHSFDRKPVSQSLPDGRGSDIRAATVREREASPLPDGRGSEKAPSVPQVVKAPSSPPAADGRAGSVSDRRKSTSVANAPGSPAKEAKSLDLVDDLPPELPFDLVDAINTQRVRAGVDPIFLDAEVSRDCQLQAEQFARHDHDKAMSANRESVAIESPLEAVEKCLKDPKRRALILESRLRTFGAGYAHNTAGQWVSVFDWTRGLDREPPLDATPVAGAIVYPVPGQLRVPLRFPGNETPDPLPQTKDKLAGYPITITFPPRTRIEAASAHLSNKKESDIPVWLSSPEKPANPRFPGAPPTTICLIAKEPLHPNSRYRVEVSATVNGAAWSAKWGFLTVSEGEIHHEQAGAFLRTLNRLRRRAGLPPVPLDAERSKACAAHVRYLTQNVPAHRTMNWNEEKSDLPGYTAAGAAVARTASMQGGGGPSEVVNGLIHSIISRPQLLHPRLHDLGLGYAPFFLGGWLWVVEMHRTPLGSGRGEGQADKEYFYPAPDQENVPLLYPPNEVPSPVPADHQGKPAGYAITALLGPRTQVKTAGAKLVDDKGDEVDGWLSSPEKPAIAGFPQYLLCFLPKSPLRPGTRYTARFQAEVNGRPWRRTWSFTTTQQPDRYADNLDEEILTQVNAVRKAAGLSQVRLDAELSTACQSHARYLAMNHQQPAVKGMGVHRQDANLPGATPEGAKAAKESVIAVMLDPQGCVENWMATLYHRVPILRPNLERVGFGHMRIQGHKWACVLDTGNGTKK